MEPRVSVIIPNYNNACFIGETIDSVIRQTFTDWELIVVDDGSTDESCEVVEEYIASNPGREIWLVVRFRRSLRDPDTYQHRHRQNARGLLRVAEFR